ncbi:MAG: MobC family plasmid mobilization relaxosome protein [Bdellovibrionales bacterium]|nr:MobC family plasmid mobilization relaxosome protein [Bdellovibrionales bacterium]
MSDEKYKRTRPFRLHMRLSANENERLEKESRDIGKSKAELVRELCFSKPSRTILMSIPQFDKLISELKRIGNNINQLAHKANMGDIVLDKNFVAVQEEMHQILMFMRLANGLR